MNKNFKLKPLIQSQLHFKDVLNPDLNLDSDLKYTTIPPEWTCYNSQHKCHMHFGIYCDLNQQLESKAKGISQMTNVDRFDAFYMQR